MQKKAMLALMLVLTMLLSGCALIQKDPAVDAATEIIRYGDTVFTKADVQAQVEYELDYMAYMYSMYGMSFDPTDPTAIADAQTSVLDAMVEEAVRSAKVKELGLDQLTEEELAEVQASADDMLAEYREYIKNFYITDETLEGEALEAEIDRLSVEMGVAAEDVLQSEMQSFTHNKLFEHVTKDVELTEEEIQARYEEILENEKQTYASDPSAFGYAANNGSHTHYRPEGYRRVKQILIKFAEEDQAVIDELQAQLDDAITEVNTKSTALAAMEVTDMDALSEQVTVTLDPATGELAEAVNNFEQEQTEEVAAALQELAVAKARRAYFEALVADATAAAFARIDAEADDVLAQLEAGADWDTLMAEKTEDPGMQGDSVTAVNGYAVCEGYTYFDEAFTAAAMAIPEAGQWSDKTQGDYGYYIIYYASDVAEGSDTLEELREEIVSGELSTKQNEVFTEQVAAWVEEANVKVNTNALKN